MRPQSFVIARVGGEAVPPHASRFWSKVDKTPGCWLWVASTFRDGRGQFRVGSKNRQAHLVAWELTFGSPPAGLLRTDCGNLRCVRPDHQALVDRKVGPINRARTTVKRFNAMVKDGPGCWLWLGSTDRLGYGQFSATAPGERRRMLRAHRFAWEQAYGTVPAAADVLHRCGNRACVRPDHLALRTAPTRLGSSPRRRPDDPLRPGRLAGR